MVQVFLFYDARGEHHWFTVWDASRHRATSVWTGFSGGRRKRKHVEGDIGQLEKQMQGMQETLDTLLEAQ